MFATKEKLNCVEFLNVRYLSGFSFQKKKIFRLISSNYYYFFELLNREYVCARLQLKVIT